MALSRGQTYRGLAALQAAGLVTIVKGGRGRRPVVEIIENAPQGAQESTEATKEANL
jgi:DNA-binding PadR family transcriptional regulator